METRELAVNCGLPERMEMRREGSEVTLPRGRPSGNCELPVGRGGVVLCQSQRGEMLRALEDHLKQPLSTFSLILAARDWSLGVDCFDLLSRF